MPPAVRLACIKHAASVRSEPGSNSQVHLRPQVALRPPTNRTQLTYSRHYGGSNANVSKRSSLRSQEHIDKHPRRIEVVGSKAPDPPQYPDRPARGRTLGRRQRIPSKSRFHYQRAKPTLSATCLFGKSRLRWSNRPLSGGREFYRNRAAVASIRASR